MIPTALIERTISRFNQRTAERQATAERLRAGSPLTANDPARVEKRLARLAQSEIARPAAVGAAPVAGVSVLERIIGKSELMSVTFLEMAVAAASTVARIRIRSGSQTIGFGTGSLIGPRILMTNNHVLGSAAEARPSLAEFNFQDGIDTPTVFALDPDSLFLSDPTLDYTIVAVKELGGQTAITSFGFNRLIEQQGKILIGEPLNIIQHPNGELKQVALRENDLQDILPQFLHYHTDTAPGSSGSPVFNNQWELVALHHSGVPRTDAQGRFLTRDGTLWDSSMGEQRIDWIANEGARVSQIVAHLKEQSLSGTARALRDTLFSAESKPVRTGPPPAARSPVSSDAAFQVAPDGTATWTVPIQISIKVGGTSGMTAPAPPATPAPVSRDPEPTPTPSAELQAALAELEAAKKKTYYDKTNDDAARTAYFAGIGTGLNGEALFEALSRLLENTHSPQPSYKPAVHVYPFVDLHPDRKLRSIYSQKAFDPEELIREDFRIEQERTERLQERLQSESNLTTERIAAEIAALEAALPFNCEHVVPQSWFDKDEPMRGDLHHLFACEPGCNSFRSNIPYFDFPDFQEVIRGECGKREADKFEPGDAKGIVSRATLYFLLRYPGQVNQVIDVYDAARLSTLVSWHNSHPVTDYERHRNAAIQEKQGNRNPLIDHPEWANTIAFAEGL